MNAKTIAAVVIALLVAVAAVPLLWTQHAQAQRPDKPQAWEHKVLGFGGGTPEKYEQRLDELASEGWEYVGLLLTSPGRVVIDPANAPQRFTTENPAAANLPLVVFKRPKR